MKFVYYLTVKIPVSYFHTKFFLPFPLYPRTDFSWSPAWFGGAVYLRSAKEEVLARHL